MSFVLFLSVWLATAGPSPLTACDSDDLCPPDTHRLAFLSFLSVLGAISLLFVLAFKKAAATVSFFPSPPYLYFLVRKGVDLLLFSFNSEHRGRKESSPFLKSL